MSHTEAQVGRGIAREQIAHEQIEEQLKRIRNSSQFSHSHRYPTFLDYVVLKAVTGHQDELKERTIGVEAFGRSPSYDLNADPIVRVTAGEVRKRLAQYYYDSEHYSELRIELRPGSYIPEFRFVSSHPASSQNDTEDSAGLAPAPALPYEPAPPDKPVPLDEVSAPHSSELSRRGVFYLVTAAMLVVAAVLTAFLTQNRSPYDGFWKPVTSSPGPVLISVGSVVVLNPPTSSSGPSPGSVGLHALYADPVALADSIAVSNLQQVLFHYSKPSSIQSSTSTTYSDLQRGPVILISGFNNPWTMRLTDSLRFHFVQSAVDVYEIVDRTDPAHKAWAINTRLPFTQVGHDFGLVARFRDQTTEQVIVVAAGIGENGTIAASELLSSPKYLADLKEQNLLPKPDQNWEAVIETKMIDGKPGPPRIVSSYRW